MLSDTEEESGEGSDAGSDELGESEYEIDHIVKSRIRKTGGKKVLEYLIHWKGYDTSEDSWTTADQFDDDDPPVLTFYTKNPSAAKKEDMQGKASKEKVGRKKKRTPSLVRSESEADDEDDEPVSVKSSKINGTIKETMEKSTPKKMSSCSAPVKSSPVSGNKQFGLLSYFSIDKKGKENEGATPKSDSRGSVKTPDTGKTSKEKLESLTKLAKERREKEAAKLDEKRRRLEERKAKEKPKGATKKRKADSDGSDFVMQDGDSADASEAEDDLQGDDEEDEDVKSDSLESVEEDDIGESLCCQGSEGLSDV